MGSSGSGAGGGSGLGGGGGRGGGGGGGAGGGSGVGHMAIADGRLTAVDTSRQEAWRAIGGVFSNLDKGYLSFTLTDPGVQEAYEALFNLHTRLALDRSWDGVARMYGVDDRPGCMMRLIDQLAPTQSVHPSLQAPLKAALQDFMLRVVGDDAIVLHQGNGAQISAALAPEAFQRTSNDFLASYLAETLRLEGRNLSRTARQHLHDYAAAKSDQIVASFEKRFHGKPLGPTPQASYRHLLRAMAEDQTWMATQLRKKVTP